jgi:hypothetical protein
MNELLLLYTSLNRPQTPLYRVTSHEVYSIHMKTYTGGCHCGAVRYEVDIENLSSAISCNCSICSKRGWLLTFVPTAQFRLLQGAGELTEYLFNRKLVHHLFCKTCGTASYGHGSDGNGNEMVAINVHCLDDVDLKSLSIQEYDGKHA